MGNKIDQNPYSIGQEVVVSFDAESREYNGRYFTNLNAWKVTPAGSPPNQPTQPSAPQNNHNEAPTSMSFSSDESTSDDLPF